MQIENAPQAKAEMLIRRPVAEVFEAFVDPAVTTKFWFTKSSGELEPDRTIKWEWETYDVSADVRVLAVEKNKRILVEWPGNGGPTRVEWRFTARADDTTFVSIINSGFSGSADEMVNQAIDSTEGFTLVLAGLKALLEHSVTLNLVSDRHPDGLGAG